MNVTALVASAGVSFVSPNRTLFKLRPPALPGISGWVSSTR